MIQRDRKRLFPRCLSCVYFTIATTPAKQQMFIPFSFGLPYELLVVNRPIPTCPKTNALSHRCRDEKWKTPLAFPDHLDYIRALESGAQKDQGGDRWNDIGLAQSELRA